MWIAIPTLFDVGFSHSLRTISRQTLVLVVRGLITPYIYDEDVRVTVSLRRYLL